MEFERSLIFEELEELKQSGCIHLLGTEPTCFEKKNCEKSLTLRKQANQIFAKKDHDEKVHEEIWKLYTKSIAYASNESEELPAGYANRSALLLHLKKYNDCLLDIDRALKVTESNALKVKLYCRQSECNAALQNGKEKESLEQANFWFSKIENAREKKSLKETIEKTEKVIKDYVADSLKKDKDYDISCDNNAFRINYCKKYGRHLIADRDIHLGELVYIDKFYVTTINSAKFYAYCSHCLAISWSTIPCDHCSFYMYCSDKCKEKAWQQYHDIECSVKFGKHPKDHTDYYTQLGLRALIMGFKETGNITKLKELTKTIDNCTDLAKRGLTKDVKFSSDSFKSIYSLSCCKSAETVKLCIPEILKILVALAKNTQIFGQDFKYTNNIDLMKNKNAIFVATLFARLSSICRINAFELVSANSQCEDSNNFLDCAMQKFCCSRGLNVSLFTSLINHSCDNNVDKFYTNDGRVVYYAVQPIKKNSQIFSSYYCRFVKTEKAFRQKMLSSIFEFHCDCVACKNNWPSLENDPADSRATKLGTTMMIKHNKTLQKIYNSNKRHRCSNKTICSFIQDTEVLLNSMTRPTFITDYFMWSLSLLIELRYFDKLEIPSKCKNNSN